MKRFVFKTMGVFMAIIVLVAQTQSLAAKTFEFSIPDIDESVFKLNEEALFAAMFELNELDNYLSQNEGTTYSDLALVGSDIITNVRTRQHLWAWIEEEKHRLEFQPSFGAVY